MMVAIYGRGTIGPKFRLWVPVGPGCIIDNVRYEQVVSLSRVQQY